MNKFIKRLLGRDPSKNAALEYITAAGFFGDQMAGLEGLEGEDIIEQSAKFSKAFIPFMNTRKDPHMLRLLRCYLENYEIYTAVNKEIKKAEKERSEDDPDKFLQELNFTKNVMRPIMESDGKIILSLTFPKLDPKTIVLDKPYILGVDKKDVSPTAKDRKSGEGKRKGFPSELPSEVQ